MTDDMLDMTERLAEKAELERLRAEVAELRAWKRESVLRHSREAYRPQVNMMLNCSPQFSQAQLRSMTAAEADEYGRNMRHSIQAMLHPLNAAGLRQDALRVFGL